MGEPSSCYSQPPLYSSTAPGWLAVLVVTSHLDIDFNIFPCGSAVPRRPTTNLFHAHLPWTESWLSSLLRLGCNTGRTAVSGWWWEAARLMVSTLTRGPTTYLTPHIALCGHFLPCNEQQCQPAGDQPDVTFSSGWNYNPVLMWSWEIFDGNVLINILNERPSYQYYRARWWT